MKQTAIITGFIALLLASCAPKAIVVEPITPAVAEAKGKAEAASSSANRVEKSASNTVERVDAVSEGIDDAIAHVDSILKAKEEMQEFSSDWQKQWAILTEIKTRNLLAEASAKSTLTQSKESKALAESASRSMVILEDHAKQTDKNTTKITTENIKLGKDAGTWRGIKATAWTLITLGVIAVLIIWGIPFIIKLIRP